MLSCKCCPYSCSCLAVAALQSKGGRQTTVRKLYRCEVIPLRAGGGIGAIGFGGKDEEGIIAGGADGGACGGELVGMRIVVEGNGFLYNMVRILAGTLLEVGCGLRTMQATAALVGADSDGGGVPNRTAAGPTLPAKGLCLERVEYDQPWPGLATAVGLNEPASLAAHGIVCGS